VDEPALAGVQGGAGGPAVFDGVLEACGGDDQCHSQVVASCRSVDLVSFDVDMTCTHVCNVMINHTFAQ